MIKLSGKLKQRLVSMLSVLLTELTDDGDRAFVQEQLSTLESSDTVTEEALIRLEKLLEPEKKVKKKEQEQKPENSLRTEEAETEETKENPQFELQEQLVRFLRYLNMIRKRKNDNNQSIRKRR